MYDYSKLVYPEVSYKINGILFSVHNKLGRYCNEKQYGDAVEEELNRLKIEYEREKTIPKSFDGEIVGRNKVDFIVDNKIILELKAVRIISRDEYYQVRRYLQACDKKLGIIVNFRDKFIKPKRILNSAAKE